VTKVTKCLMQRRCIASHRKYKRPDLWNQNSEALQGATYPWGHSDFDCCDCRGWI